MNSTPQPPPNRDWVTTQYAETPKPHKSGPLLFVIIPAVVGIVAGLLLGHILPQNSEPVPTETVTAEPSPAPTVTETVSAVPQACLDGFEAGDRIRGTAAEIMYSISDHFAADQELFANFTEAQVDIYAVELERHNEVMVEQGDILTDAVRDYETARAGCK